MNHWQPDKQHDVDRQVKNLFAQASPKYDVRRARRNLLTAIEERQRTQPGWFGFLSLREFLVGDTAPCIAFGLSCLLLFVMLAQPKLGTVEGTVSAYNPLTRSWSELKGNQIPTGVLLKIAGDSSRVTLPEKSILDLTGGSLFELHDDKGTVVRLFRGRLDADIAPQPEGKTFRVKTPTMEVTVAGTQFSVTVGDSP